MPSRGRKKATVGLPAIAAMTCFHWNRTASNAVYHAAQVGSRQTFSARPIEGEPDPQPLVDSPATHGPHQILPAIQHSHRVDQASICDSLALRYSPGLLQQHQHITLTTQASEKSSNYLSIPHIPPRWIAVHYKPTGLTTTAAATDITTTITSRSPNQRQPTKTTTPKRTRPPQAHTPTNRPIK